MFDLVFNFFAFGFLSVFVALIRRNITYKKLLRDLLVMQVIFSLALIFSAFRLILALL